MVLAGVGTGTAGSVYKNYSYEGQYFNVWSLWTPFIHTMDGINTVGGTGPPINCNLHIIYWLTVVRYFVNIIVSIVIMML